MSTAWHVYASHGLITEPGDQTALFQALPTDIPALCRIVQGLMIHVFWANQYGVQLTPEREAEVQLRYVPRQLERLLELDARPLTVARPPDRRLVGNCRDFTVMLTSILRSHGIPARARCGFARYFAPDFYVDHWVCEVWSAAEQRWILVDAQLDELQAAKLSLTFDPLDVPRDQFITGGKAWQMCRNGDADPDTFGIHDMHGMWFVRGDLVRDIAALNKVELLPWDSWGIIERTDEELTSDDLAQLDRVAQLAAGDVPDLDAVRRLYEDDDRLRVPAEIRSYTQTGVLDVALTPATSPATTVRP